MAQVLKRAAEMFPSVPIIALDGVSFAAKELGVKVTHTILPPDIKTPVSRSTGNYNSKTVVDEQKKWLVDCGMFPALALTLTVPFHMGRVKWIMEKEGFRVLPVPISLRKQKELMDSDSFYLSVRIAARIPCGMLALFLREICARLLFLKNGWM